MERNYTPVLDMPMSSQFETVLSYEDSQEVDESEITTIEPELHRESRLLAFDYRLEIDSVEETLNLQETDPEAFAQRWVNLPDFLKFQIETYLGERNRVGLSSIDYTIVDGELYGQGMDKPMSEVIANGVVYRADKGTPEDRQRELAELAGFDYINSVMTDPDTKMGSMLLSVSPPSGSYKKNFYDVYTLHENEEGERSVNMSRFASGLTSRGYLDRLPELLNLENTQQIPNNLIPKPSEFLTRPLLVDRFDNAQDLHAFLHVDIDIISNADFDQVKAYVKPFITHYIDTLMEHSDDPDEVKLALKTVINAADYAAKQVKEGKTLDTEIDELAGEFFMERVEDFSSQRMETVDSDCGGLGDEDLESSNGSPFGVVEMAAKTIGEADSMGKLKFNCPACGHENKRPYGGFVKVCQNRGCSDPTRLFCGPKESEKMYKKEMQKDINKKSDIKVFDAKAYTKSKQETKIRKTEKTTEAFSRLGIGESLKAGRTAKNERRQV